MYMISTTGRDPRMAAPSAAPTIAVSEIGVSKTRRPKVVWSPFVAPNGPLGTATSSPNTITRSSAERAHLSASLTARM